MHSFTSPSSRLRAPAAALIALLLVPVLASGARAAGANLSWDDCGRAGKTDLAASCVETPVPYVLVGSVVPPPGMVQVVGFQAIIDIQTEGEALPSWWEMGQGCRSGKLTSTWDFTSGPYACSDLWEGQALGGMLYVEGEPGRNRARLKLIAAVQMSYARSMNPGTEYYLFKIQIQKSGTNACAGCRTPACIQLTEVRLTQQEPLDDAFIRERADLNHVTWQGGISSPDGDLPACRADAVQNRTWGQIKSIYR